MQGCRTEGYEGYKCKDARLEDTKDGGCCLVNDGKRLDSLSPRWTFYIRCFSQRSWIRGGVRGGVGTGLGLTGGPADF